MMERAERPETFTAAFERWCDSTPEALALRLLDEHGEIAAERTYGDLGRATTAAAALVARTVAPGDAAVLLYPPGLDFIEAFFGCLKAGVVAVPVYPPDPMRLSATISRLVSIVDDARPAVILTDRLIAEHADLLFAEAPSLRQVPLVVVDATAPPTDLWTARTASPGDVAFVQYSSGSTGEPNGVVLSHDNLDANLRSIEAAFGIDQTADTGLSWLPTYHDMGLIGAVILPLTLGGLTYLMSPIDFLRRPWSWLEAMSRYRCTISGSPNFGYELCARKTADDVVDRLDLAPWRVAFNGAEPLDPRTLGAFVERFAPAGFAASAMLPCYGLAEATLLVSGKRPTDAPKVVTVDADALASSRFVPSVGGRRLVSCGRPSAGVDVRIVDPLTGEPIPDGHVGEIEVAGRSVAQGYWARQPDRDTFREVDGRAWLRTGDLGGLLDGELVPTGRLKDALVVRGRNVYPQDLERAAEAADPSLRPGCSVAFAVEPGQDERIVVVCEVAGGDVSPELAGAISASVAREGVRPAVVVLAPPHSVPKTSSGKVRRAACRTAWRSGSLGALLERGSGSSDEPGPRGGEEEGRSAAEIIDLIRAEVARALDDPGAHLPAELAFADLGLDSAQLVELHTRLETALGRTIPPEVMWSSPTIGGLARALTRRDPTPDGPGPTERRTAPGEQDPAPSAAPAAIVGIGLRVAAVEGPDAFWARFSGGDPAGELRPASSVPAPGGSAWRFDARFFGISAREAARMDPAHRTVLEVAWHAVEDAGVDPRSLARRHVGVFIGASPSEYGVVTATSGRDPDVHSVTGLAPALAANRLSYLLDLRGPSLTVDTACSSSLVAVHLALRSLRSGECDLAIVGGVSALVATDVSDALASVGALSATGACHVFDEAADGYVRSAGCGIVVLERHDDARAAGRRCYALVRGTAVNQDGRSNGLTAPNAASQREVIQAAHADAGASPTDVVAVEAHGTGTPLGDPIECGALRDVLGPDGGPVQLTSVKSTVGHLEAAAGVVGLIRTALCADRGVLPRQAGFATLNPRIELGPRLSIPTTDQPWDGGLGTVSSFGFGGTNAHVVVARAADDGPATRPLDLGVLPLSAATAEALGVRGRHVAELLQTVPPADVRARLAPVAGAHRYRAVLAEDPAAVAAEVARWEDDGLQPVTRRDRLVVVFGGQGSLGGQAWHPDLVGDSRLRDTLLALEEEAGEIGGFSARHWMAAEGEVTTEVAQPLITIVSLTLVRALEALGIVPDLVLGHSVGEIAAMAAAGGLTDAEAVRLAATRGRIMQRGMATGAMATMLLDAAGAADAIGESGAAVAIAALNAPNVTGVAGPPAEVAVLHRHCEERGIALLPVAVDRAFHTSAVEPCRSALEMLGRDHPAGPTTRRLITTTDAALRPEGWRIDEGHWYEHALLPVRFDAAVTLADEGGQTTFLEVGTRPMVGKLRRRCDERWVALTGAAADGSLLGSVLGQLHLAGHDVPWAEVARGPVPRSPMPPYPFGGESHWIGDGPDQRSSDRRPAPVAEPATTPEVAVSPVPEGSVTTAPRGPIDPLFVSLAGFGVGPGSRIGAPQLGPVASARAADVADALGAELVDATQPVDLVLVPAGRPAPGGGRRITVDDLGCPTGSLGSAPRRRRPRLALAYFGDHEVGGEAELYADLVAFARRADELGFAAVWTPERHFDSFGGPYPAPAVLSSALARETSRLDVRAGSVVLPLSHPARVVEEWSLVDNLSRGRAGIALASGWRDRDRILAPTEHAPDIEASIDVIRRLWRGEEVDLVGPDGHVERARVRPQPVQRDAPLWLTVMKNPDSWRRAGRLGLDILTNLIGRPMASLGAAIEDYQRERAAHGFGPGRVTVMLHAHADLDEERARAAARAPLERYLAASATVFSQATGIGWLDERTRRLSPAEFEDEVEAVLATSTQRYLGGCSLIGSAESCGRVLDRLGDEGVTEVAALVDFGFDRDSVLRTLELLADAASSTSGPEPAEHGSTTEGARR